MADQLLFIYIQTSFMIIIPLLVLVIIDINMVVHGQAII